MLFQNGTILHLLGKILKPYAAGTSCHTHDPYSNKKVWVLKAVSCYFPVLTAIPSSGTFWGPHHDAPLARKNGRVLTWRRALPFLRVITAGSNWTYSSHFLSSAAPPRSSRSAGVPAGPAEPWLWRGSGPWRWCGPRASSDPRRSPGA